MLRMFCLAVHWADRNMLCWMAVRNTQWLRCRAHTQGVGFSGCLNTPKLCDVSQSQCYTCSNTVSDYRCMVMVVLDMWNDLMKGWDLTCLSGSFDLFKLQGPSWDRTQASLGLVVLLEGWGKLTRKPRALSLAVGWNENNFWRTSFVYIVDGAGASIFKNGDWACTLCMPPCIILWKLKQSDFLCYKRTVNSV